MQEKYVKHDLAMHNSTAKKKIIAVFGGSFNPPLSSHVELAEKIIQTNTTIEKIVFVPVNSKYNKQGLISNEHRYNMLELICNANPNFSISRIEIDRNRQLYTIETLCEMREIYKDYEICFILGTDNLKQLHTWKDIERLLSEFRIIVIQRDNDNIDQILENKIIKKYKDSFIILDKSIKANLSSTYVKKLVKEGKDYKQYMPEEVYNYIKQNGLYK